MHTRFAQPLTRPSATHALVEYTHVFLGAVSASRFPAAVAASDA